MQSNESNKKQIALETKILSEIDKNKTLQEKHITQIDKLLEEKEIDYSKLLVLKIKQLQHISNTLYREMQLQGFILIEKRQQEVIELLFKLSIEADITKKTINIIDAKKMFTELENEKKDYIYKRSDDKDE